ncbi:Type IIS restriction enzyme Eco57I [bioreactor metagenome]|uniref:site-specific DNA-methyltransferase (adenine-specific) n=1 Tax=bioreactor metagenome TaxID=1076179 RepID=A0A644TUD1_9ZZZZ
MASAVQKLVSKFASSLSIYKSSLSPLNELTTRLEYIDCLFELLGWDVKNVKGVSPNLKEVIFEVNMNEDSTRPDYAFTLSGVRKFFVEAKKPIVSIEIDPKPAFQARRYGWSAKHQIVVLTNFEHLAIYDATVPPSEKDTVNTALLKRYHYTEYVEKWDEISSYISRDTVYSGLFEDKLKTILKEGPKHSIDKYFLEQIKQWRVQLANYIYKKHSDYTLDLVNDLTQAFINQMIFLRVCEDRNLPLYHKLNETLKNPTIVKDELSKVFVEADKKYNSGLFSREYIVFDLNNAIIMDIIESLYMPKSPYAFNVIDSNLLGEIYEVFLSERMVLEDNNIILAPKEESVNRDIVTTPSEIVKYMVRRTLEPLCRNKLPEEILELKIADIACGSGVFLLEVFDFLIQHVTSWYSKNEPTYLIEGEYGTKNLPFEDKCHILLSCIYGIDIDPNAVEIAKFGLLLKLLENETTPSLELKIRLLPYLDENIKQGNTLVDMQAVRKLHLSCEERVKIAPFAWGFNNGVSDFDVIIGNPPYVTTEGMINILPEEEFAIYKRYQSAYKQFDKYYLFIERAVNKLRLFGTLCFIVPNKFSKIASGKNLRQLLTTNSYVSEFIDFESSQLFKEKHKTVYSSILTVKIQSQKQFNYEEVEDLQKWWANQDKSHRRKTVTLSSNVIGENPWMLVTHPKQVALLDALFSDAVLLGKIAEVFNGIQTSAERPYPVFWFSMDEVIKEKENCYTIDRMKQEFIIEKDILRPFFKSIKQSEKKMSSYDYTYFNKWIIFPYDANGKLYPPTEMQTRFPNTWNYLLANYDRLKNRDVPHATPETWYHYGRIQALKSFTNNPKLIVGILSKQPMYLLDYENDILVASGGTAGNCAISEKEGSPYKLEYLQAILSHPSIEWLCSIIGSDFEGGFYSRGTYVLERIPIKKINFNKPLEVSLYNNIVTFSKRIYNINQTLHLTKSDIKKRNALQSEKKQLIGDIEHAVTELYKIDALLDVLKK